MNDKNHAEEVEVGRGVISGRFVRLSNEAAHIGAPGACGPDSQPSVEMIRDGDVLRAVKVTCGCGKVILLRCVYAETPN